MTSDAQFWAKCAATILLTMSYMWRGTRNATMPHEEISSLAQFIGRSVLDTYPSQR